MPPFSSRARCGIQASCSIIEEMLALGFSIYPMIEERRASANPTDNLLTMLIQANEDEFGSFNNQLVRNKTITLLVAGHETSAQMLAWAIYLLGQSRQP